MARIPQDHSDPARHGRTVVLLPTFNEAENLPSMLREIRARVETAHVLVIDDGSPDGTGRLAEQARADDGRIHFEQRGRRSGLGSAYRFGYRWALDRGYERIVQMDCDFSHDPVDLPRLIDALRHYPVVVGSRRVPGGGSEGWPWYRRTLSSAGSAYARRILGSPVRDLTSGFKAFRASALSRLPIESLRSEGFVFQVEVTSLLLASGIDVHEIPIRFIDRRRGRSKMSAGIVLEGLVRVWSVRRRVREIGKSR